MDIESNHQTSSSPAIPWVERYRPKTLSEVSHQTEIISTLKNAIETNRLPHLLFYGMKLKTLVLFYVMTLPETNKYLHHFFVIDRASRHR